MLTLHTQRARGSPSYTVFHGIPGAHPVKGYGGENCWDVKHSVSLSRRELDVINLLKVGKTSWDISRILGISERTVNYHIGNIMRKLDAINRVQAVCEAANMDLIDL